MSEEKRKSVWRRWVMGGGLFTARGLLVRAAWIAVAFAVLHGLGWREETSVLCGNVAGSGDDAMVHAVMGMVYALAYFAVVVVGPVLVIAAGMLGGWEKLESRKAGKREMTG